MSGFARRWWPVLALALVLAALQAKLWFGHGGLPDARALQQSVRDQASDNARLEQRNDALGAEVEDLKSGETAVEERARSELGMIKPGETFYRVVEPHAGTPVAPPAAVPPDPTAPTDATGNAPARDPAPASLPTTDADANADADADAHGDAHGDAHADTAATDPAAEPTR